MTIALDRNLGTSGADSAGTTVALTTAATAASGSFIVLSVTWFDTSGFTLSSVSGGGLTWTIDKQDKSNNDGVAIVSAQAPSGLASSTTITATYSGSVAGARFIAGESFTGVATSSPVDGTPPAVHLDGATGAWTTNSATLLATSMLFALALEQASLMTSTTTGPAAELHDFGSGGAGATDAWLLPGSAGSFAIAGTWSGTPTTGLSSAIAVAYKAAPPSASTTPFPVFLPRNTTGRGVRAPRTMRLYVRTPPPPPLAGTTFIDSATGALIFGGAVQEAWTWAFPQQHHARRLPITRGLRDSAGLRGYARTPSVLAYAAVYTDTATGSWIFGSSVVEAKRGTDAGSGTWIFAGSRVEAKRGTDARSGSIIFGGTRAEAITFVQARSGAVIFGGTRTELKRGTDARSGAVIFGGSRTELKRYGDVRSGAVTFGGSATQLRVGTDARTGTIIFGGHSSTVVTTTARAKVTFIIPDARGRRRRTRQ